ncbi:helix-turn-helix domain-containing protein [Bizionia arctica]|uniref:HTH araC/xylS-type domain-containing protein n=1 Tax=Bizionia arctica TaxID=1495645 RepID=A0A917LMH2_9FLAO|nr:helix-turn-helix domain-containing protein [Bizionia arctica]GGG44363.1 hypothetical protein GCM10010976_14950 [Bizionia arctica]
MFSIQFIESKYLFENYNVPFYSIILLDDESHFSVNFVKYKTKQKSILFLSPYQNLKWHGSTSSKVKLLQFHGDFYCIEYHKKEVACNGLLFNNIYLQPYISLNNIKFQEIVQLIDKMEIEVEANKRFSKSILKSYLQLILAICSSEKDDQLGNRLSQQTNSNELFIFQELLELHFHKERNSSFYANKLSMSLSSFSKKIKIQFGKTPTQIIQERVILEAKKLLHLTFKTVKEVAIELNFDDEFYFSRYFKKEVGLSPTHFREKVGISVVAK